MERATQRKLVLVVRETRLDGLIARYNTLEQARFYVEHLGVDFSDYVLEDKTYKAAVAAAESALRHLGRVHVLQRRYVTNYLFGDDDIVVAVGQDGLLANVLKYTRHHPVIGVNPDPDRWDGVLLPFTVHELERAAAKVLAGRHSIAKVTIAKAELNDGQVMYAVNDLFIGARTHVSARYRIDIGGRMEHHASSGVIVSTGLGSTGWLKSIVSGAVGIASRLSGRQVALAPVDPMPWDAGYLFFSVREPFPSRTTAASIVFGKVIPSDPLKLTSQMPGNGVIFSDGIENDFVEFNSGMTATITVAEKSGHVVVK